MGRPRTTQPKNPSAVSQKHCVLPSIQYGVELTKPEGLGEYASAWWDSLEPNLRQVCGNTDIPSLTMLANWYQSWMINNEALKNFEKDGLLGSVQHQKLINITRACTEQYNRLAKEFGLTPYSRTGVKIADTTHNDSREDLFE